MLIDASNGKKFSRRAMLGAIAGGAALAPFIPYLSSHVEADGVPSRLFLIWTPNGSIHDLWKPTGGETDFAFGRVSAPLERHRDDLVMISGLNKVPIDPDGGGDDVAVEHYRGIGCTWTAETFAPGSFATHAGRTIGYVQGASVDQYIASRLAPPTRFRSLELGLMTGRGSPMDRMIYQGPGMPLTPEESPFRAFDRLFGDATGGDPLAAERIRAERRSVIDTVRGSLSRVRARVGRDDRARLDAHLESVRAMERRLEDTRAALCAPPELGAPTDHVPTLLNLHADLLAAAFTCDLTRVASFQLDHPSSGSTWSWLGHTRYLHAIGHFDEPGAREIFIDADVWLHEAVAGVLDRLRGHDLLRSSLVVWSQELARSDAHYLGCVPFVLAGNCNGALDTGRFLDYGGAPSERPSEGQPHSKLLTSICHAMGLTDVDHYGNPAWSGEGPLPGLLS